MSEHLHSRVLEASRKNAYKALTESYLAFRKQPPEEQRLNLYEQTFKSYRNYATQFAQFHNTANPFEHAVAGRNRLHNGEITAAMYDTNHFFKFINDFQNQPFWKKLNPNSAITKLEN